MRIVSLLPSATEIVCAIGLGDELVGVTHECDYPAEAVGKPVITRSVHDLAASSSRDIHRLVSASVHGGSSLYHLDEDALAAARPDLIITQELCRVCAVSYRDVNEAARAIDADITVVSLEPTSIEGIFNTITTVGAMAEAEDAAIDLVESLRERLGAVEAQVQARRDGGQHAASGRRSRMAGSAVRHRPLGARADPARGWLGRARRRRRAHRARPPGTSIGEVEPEMLLLMPCGFHLAETVAEWARTPRPPGYAELAAVRRDQIVALDGSAYFSRPGPRVIDGIELLAEIFDPGGFVDIAPAGSWTPVQA